MDVPVERLAREHREAREGEHDHERQHADAGVEMPAPDGTVQVRARTAGSR